MEKFNDWFIALCTAIAGVSTFIVKRLFKRIDKLEDRVDDIDRELLTKTDLDISLEPIRDTNTMILNHLLEHRRGENLPKKREREK
jgi:Mg2+ and Co2+ transporter CorA|tara:strand:- start:6448 stop:6705 length:258 start_codon:yes stop_codon:yes gene_type:complete